MSTYREFCRLRDLHTPGANAPKHTEADAFFMAAAQLAVPEGYKLVPLEPTPEIIAGAAVAIWPTASAADIALARLAAPIVLMQMDMAEGTTVDAVAGMLATMVPAYRAMLAAAPIPPTRAQPSITTPHVASDKSPSMQDLHFLTDVVTAAGLLCHGKRDKGLAKRISEHAYKVRAAIPLSAFGVPFDGYTAELLDGERMLSASPAAPEAHSYAVAVPDGFEQVRFRFFKDLNTDERKKVFKAFGVWPGDDEGKNIPHVWETLLLRSIFNIAAPAALGDAKDAERYLELRDGDKAGDLLHFMLAHAKIPAGILDAKIDAAIATRKFGNKGATA